MTKEKKEKPFLIELKSRLKKHYNKYKFVLVCGGGKVAREYQHILEHEHRNEKERSLAGIRATRLNAIFAIQVFGKEANDKLPSNINQVEDSLPKNNVVICGALRYADKQTSDSTAAKIAAHLKAIFINITNVAGLYTADPRKYKNSRIIRSITWKNFREMAEKITYKPGQHFVLDQTAAVIIEKYRIPTYIIGPNLKHLSAVLNKKPFIGTTISNETL